MSTISLDPFFAKQSIVQYKNALFLIILITGIIEMVLIIVSKNYINKKEFRTTALGFIILISTSFINSSVFASLNIFIIFNLINQYSPFEYNFTWFWWFYGLFVYELFYWIQHFLAHKIRILWCIHFPHHAPMEMNLFVGFNHSFLESLFIRPFFVAVLPLLMGVHPIIIMSWNVVDTIWGCFLHISPYLLKGNFGILEHIFQTPSHHRVHHANNSNYYDTNFTSITLFWDYFFKTFTSGSRIEIETFGTSRTINTGSFFDVHFSEFILLWSDIKNAPDIKNKFLYLIMPPGWNPFNNQKLLNFGSNNYSQTSGSIFFIKNRRINFIKSIINYYNNIFFFPKLKSAYNKLCPVPKLVIDVGANEGQSIDFFLSLNPDCEIHSFEPNKRLYENLKARFHSKNNVKIYNLGISDASGERIFHESRLDMISSFEQINFNSKYVDKKAFILGLRLPELILRSYPVEVVSLSSFISQIKLNRDIDIIKIDTEGHEYYCLSGLFSECLSIKINHIQLEQHFNDQYLNSIGFKHVHRILKSNGFYLQKKITNCYGDFNEFIYSTL